jgi:hypothetical protein
VVEDCPNLLASLPAHLHQRDVGHDLALSFADQLLHQHREQDRHEHYILNPFVVYLGVNKSFSEWRGTERSGGCKKCSLLTSRAGLGLRTGSEDVGSKGVGFTSGAEWACTGEPNDCRAGERVP